MRCEDCGGSGKAAVLHFSDIGTVKVLRELPCPSCGGTGQDYCCGGADRDMACVPDAGDVTNTGESDKP